MRVRLLGVGLAACLAAAAPAGAGPRVRLDTTLGPITLELADRQAPITTANFLKYVDAGRFAGTTFYRTARSKRDPRQGLVQGGINHKVVKAFNPIPHEPTDRTGLRHGDATISMARNAPGTAMGDFFITIGPAAYLDARPGNPGYAAFGKVVAGMPVVRRILALPTWPGGFSYTTMEQSIREPVRILAAKRLP